MFTTTNVCVFIFSWDVYNFNKLVVLFVCLFVPALLVNLAMLAVPLLAGSR